MLKKSHPLNTVTPVTKALAMFLFISIPITTFILGINYGFQMGKSEVVLDSYHENKPIISPGVSETPSIDASTTPTISMEGTNIYKYFYENEILIEDNRSFVIVSNNDPHKGISNKTDPETYIRIIDRQQNIGNEIGNFNLGIIDEIDHTLWTDSSTLFLSIQGISPEYLGKAYKLSYAEFTRKVTLTEITSIPKLKDQNIFFGSLSPSAEYLYIEQFCAVCNPNYIKTIRILNVDTLQIVNSITEPDDSTIYGVIGWRNDNQLEYKIEHEKFAEGSEDPYFDEDETIIEYLEVK